ncbi:MULTISPECIES: hypothetical protein [Pontibacter]|uniref:Uncharacterized protein n=1 Tax=Pontibacter rugosus TaxID=1745966 RepID=A0ABW3SLS4_9BACT|nr:MULTISPECIES: hypothetical protein [Pontibacter]
MIPILRKLAQKSIYTLLELGQAMLNAINRAYKGDVLEIAGMKKPVRHLKKVDYLDKDAQAYECVGCYFSCYSGACAGSVPLYAAAAVWQYSYRTQAGKGKKFSKLQKWAVSEFKSYAHAHGRSQLFYHDERISAWRQGQQNTF